MLTRRDALLGVAALGACAAAPSRAEAQAAERIAAIETRIGGRVGVAAIDTQSGARILHRAQERFALCSTFKWLLAAQILQLSEHGFDLGARMLYSESDLLEYAPATRARLAEGGMNALDLCEAAVVLSDNTAANLLLVPGGGPEGLTHFLRANGDSMTRLDRIEPDLNENAPGDPRDTTTPLAMAQNARWFLSGEAQVGGVAMGPPLNAVSRARLVGWMVACETGRARLRGGFPASWRAGDKTGTGARGAANDVAIVWPPGRAPIVVAVYLSGSEAPLDALNVAHAEIGRIVAESWG